MLEQTFRQIIKPHWETGTNWKILPRTTGRKQGLQGCPPNKVIIFGLGFERYAEVNSGKEAESGFVPSWNMMSKSTEVGKLQTFLWLDK